MPVKGFYINLDRSAERRAQIEAELEKLAAVGTYQRFPAIDGSASTFRPDLAFRGILGCFLSHTEVLRANAAAGAWLHILEDDAMVSRFAPPVIDILTNDPNYDQFDIIFTNTRILGTPPVISHIAGVFDRSVEVDDAGKVTTVKTIHVLSAATGQYFFATSYLVNPRSAQKIVDKLAPILWRPRQTHLDVALWDLARSGDLNVGYVVPFVTLPRPNAVTTIQGPPLDWEEPYSVLDGMLYADREPEALREQLRALTVQSKEPSMTRDMIADVYRAVIAGSSTAPVSPF